MKSKKTKKAVRAYSGSLHHFFSSSISVLPGSKWPTQCFLQCYYLCFYRALSSREAQLLYSCRRFVVNIFHCIFFKGLNPKLMHSGGYILTYIGNMPRFRLVSGKRYCRLLISYNKSIFVAVIPYPWACRSSDEII